MILAKVTGSVVAGNKTDWIENPVFLLVNEIDSSGKETGHPFIALDLLGTGRGEIVLISQGSSSRQTEDTKDRPVDAVIAGIVDIVEKNGSILYRKDG